MKEKFKNACEKIEDFMEDHGDHIVEAAMVFFYVAVGIGYGTSLHLANKEKRIQIKALKK